MPKCAIPSSPTKQNNRPTPRQKKSPSPHSDPQSHTSPQMAIFARALSRRPKQARLNVYAKKRPYAHAHRIMPRGRPHAYMHVFTCVYMKGLTGGQGWLKWPRGRDILHTSGESMGSGEERKLAASRLHTHIDLREARMLPANAISGAPSRCRDTFIISVDLDGSLDAMILDGLSGLVGYMRLEVIGLIDSVMIE